MIVRIMTIMLLVTTAANCFADTTKVVSAIDSIALRKELINELTTDSITEVNEQRFYDSLKAKTQRTLVSRMMYDFIFTRQLGDTSSKHTVIDETEQYEVFKDMPILSIKTWRENVFDGATSKLEKIGNKLNIKSNEHAVRRDLLFKTGQPLNPMLLVKNTQLLRSRKYLYDAWIDVIQPADTNGVDIIVNTRDRWTISGDADINFAGRSMVEIYDVNVFGTGNKLSIATNFDTNTGSYGGSMLEYDIPNILGTFYQGNIMVGKRFDYNTSRLSIIKNLILPTDYEVGAQFANNSQPYYMLLPDKDSTTNIKSRSLDAWLGKSHHIPRFSGSIYIAGRFDMSYFQDRPDVNATLNPAFHNRKQILLSGGIYREHFYSANMIYAYGVKEYLAAGYKAELTAGYNWAEFNNNWYIGASYRKGGFANHGSYVMGSGGLGSYINSLSGKLNRTTVSLSGLYFSKLYSSGRSKIRHFLSLNIVQGWNRLQGSDELIDFTDESGPRGFNAYVAGLNRAVLNSELVVFKHWKPYDFKFAFFGYADFGLIGNNINIFYNHPYTTFGLGVRIKNERLVFSAIQIRLGVCVGRAGFIDNRYFDLTSKMNVPSTRYIPEKPDIVSYR